MGVSGRFDVWSLAARSLGIAWRQKPLWLFGLLASVNGNTALTVVDEWGPASRQYLMGHSALLVLIVFLVVVGWLALFALNLLSRGALIAGADVASRGGGTTLGVAWGSGLRAFWRLLGLLALAVAAFLVVTGAVIVPLVLPLAAGVPGLVIAIVIGAVLFLPYLGFLFALTFVVTYAERAVVIDGAGVLASVRAGWEITRAHPGRSMLVWLVGVLSTLAYAVALLAALGTLALPFLLVATVSPIAALLLGVPVALAVAAIATGAFGCYSYALWTIAYTELRRSTQALEDLS